MRIGGIASGMDTEQMVKDLMRMERLRIDRFFQQEQRLKWRQDAFTNINRNMANFILDSRKAFGLTTMTSTGTMLSNSVNNLNWVKKAISSNESVVKATANANAMSGTHTVQVKQLAEVASITSETLTGEEGILDASGNFKSEHYGEFTIQTDSGKLDIKIGNGSGEARTINDLVRIINNATEEKADGKEVSLGLRASYDASLGKIMITTKETGVEKTIQVTSNINGTVKKIFGESASVFSGVTGKNAQIYFNGTGEEHLVSKSTNNFSIFGINLQLQASQLEEAEPIIIRVDTDVDSVFDKVKNFVDEYNKIIDEINGQVNQKYYRNFPPLTEEQKQAMTEKDIELWEEKAKSGLLRGDNTLTRTLQNMRSSLYETVEGVSGSFNHITQIGITTGAYQDGGKLVINEQKLREAISNDPEGVMDLLFKTSDSNLTGKDKVSNTGLVNRIYDGLVDGMKEVIRHSGPGEDSNLLRNVRSNILIDFVTKQSSISLLDKDLNNLNSRIAREEDILRRREDRYWQQFSAMEKALSQMQNQSAWLMSQLGMGQ